jgi:hypothetical protein
MDYGTIWLTSDVKAGFRVPPPRPGVIGRAPQSMCVNTMLFDDQNLREMIARTPNEIELRNVHGRCYQRVSSSEALTLDLDLFVGVGNRKRILFMRHRTAKCALNAGSCTTQRLTNAAGVKISPPMIREHRVRG